MKKLTVAVAMTFIMSFGINGVSGVNNANAAKAVGHISNETLSDTSIKLCNQIKEIGSQYAGVAQANQQLKEAGASYQTSLTADTVNLSRYTTSEQQSIIAGVYTFDAGYAALFFQKKDMAASLMARKSMYEKIGLCTSISPKMKALIKNPDSIRDYKTWAAALDDVRSNFLASGLTTDKRLDIMVDSLYGAIIEGMYVVTESIAQADYAPEMLALLNNQQERVELLIKMLNVFRGNEAFEKEVEFKERLELIGDVNNLLIVDKFTKHDVDSIRKLIAPERQAILNGDV